VEGNVYRNRRQSLGWVMGGPGVQGLSFLIKKDVKGGGGGPGQGTKGEDD